MSPGRVPAGHRAVLAVEDSSNAKLGLVSATYLTQHSCPPACPFLGAGCYAEHGLMRFLSRRLGRSQQRTPAELAKLEARAIDALSGDRPLRLHVVGDCRTSAAARIVAEAVRRYQSRRGSAVWTYTHAWRDVPRACWGAVSVLASCESIEQVRQAQERGYAAALVVDRFRQDAAYDLGGVGVLPCPHQTRRVTCRHCRLCWDDQRLLARGLAIGFEAHGRGAARVRLALPVLESPE